MMDQQSERAEAAILATLEGSWRPGCQICRCKACANISSLDLKFFIHYGTFGIQRISDYDELVGSDINLLHRLLKNSVTEETGFRAYALYTEAAIRQLDVEDIGESMALHNEAYEYLGEVKVLVQDMHLVWKKKHGETAVTFPFDRILDRSEVHINMPRERVWDYMTQPEFRNTLIGSDGMGIANRAHGRIAPGSVYQCYHGDKWVPQTILEWQPFERMITRESASMVPDLSAIVEYRLDATEGGTRLTKLFAKPTGSFLGCTLIRLLAPVYSRMIGKQVLEAFRREIENDLRAHSEALESEAEFNQ